MFRHVFMQQALPLRLLASAAVLVLSADIVKATRRPSGAPQTILSADIDRAMRRPSGAPQTTRCYTLPRPLSGDTAVTVWAQHYSGFFFGLEFDPLGSRASCPPLPSIHNGLRYGGMLMFVAIGCEVHWIPKKEGHNELFFFEFKIEGDHTLEIQINDRRAFLFPIREPTDMHIFAATRNLVVDTVEMNRGMRRLHHGRLRLGLAENEEPTDSPSGTSGEDEDADEGAAAHAATDAADSPEPSPEPSRNETSESSSAPVAESSSEPAPDRASEPSASHSETSESSSAPVAESSSRLASDRASEPSSSSSETAESSSAPVSESSSRPASESASAPSSEPASGLSSEAQDTWLKSEWKFYKSYWQTIVKTRGHAAGTHPRQFWHFVAWCSVPLSLLVGAFYVLRCILTRPESSGTWMDAQDTDANIATLWDFGISEVNGCVRELRSS